MDFKRQNFLQFGFHYACIRFLKVCALVISSHSCSSFNKVCLSSRVVPSLEHNREYFYFIFYLFLIYRLLSNNKISAVEDGAFDGIKNLFQM